MSTSSSSSSSSSSSCEMKPAVYESLLKIPGNDRCVDCGKLKPDWGSPKLGILFCFECSGRHRNMGTHISFVRSVRMDNWTSRELDLMRMGGNRQCNEFLRKYRVPTDLSCTSLSSSVHSTSTASSTEDSSTTATHRQKYDNPAAELYRQILQARLRGLPEPTELPIPSTPPSPIPSSPTLSPAASGGKGTFSAAKLLGKAKQNNSGGNSSLPLLRMFRRGSYTQMVET